MSGAVASTLGRLGFGAMAGWENDGNSLLESRGKPWKALDLRDQHINTMVSGVFFPQTNPLGCFAGEWPSVANHNKDTKPTGT